MEGWEALGDTSEVFFPTRHLPVMVEEDFLAEQRRNVERGRTHGVRNSAVFMKENESNLSRVLEELKHKIKDLEDTLKLSELNNAEKEKVIEGLKGKIKI